MATRVATELARLLEIQDPVIRKEAISAWANVLKPEEEREAVSLILQSLLMPCIGLITDWANRVFPELEGPG
jgi:hypothetical protein